MGGAPMCEVTVTVQQAGGPVFSGSVTVPRLNGSVDVNDLVLQGPGASTLTIDLGNICCPTDGVMTISAGPPANVTITIEAEEV